MACFCLPLTGFLYLVNCISVKMSSLVTETCCPGYAHGIWLSEAGSELILNCSGNKQFIQESRNVKSQRLMFNP